MSESFMLAAAKMLHVARMTSIAIELELNPFRWELNFYRSTGFLTVTIGPLGFSFNGG